jgi:hypothetical protein
MPSVMRAGCAAVPSFWTGKHRIQRWVSMTQAQGPIVRKKGASFPDVACRRAVLLGYQVPGVLYGRT